MTNFRLIARLDIKAPNLVKGIQLEGLRKIGDPNSFAKKYYEQGIDEIYYQDIVASLYERNSLVDIIEETTKDIFVPITVGGGIRTIDDVTKILNSGADKVSINTEAIKNPEIISEVAKRFGSQCMVLSVEAKQDGDHWEAYFDNGREHSHLNAVKWAKEGESRGAGEIFLTSVDREGTAKGFDMELIQAVTELVNVPVIASGGMGKLEDVEGIAKEANADGVAMARVLHYGQLTVPEIRQFCVAQGIPVRTIAS
jgi:cyclase